MIMTNNKNPTPSLKITNNKLTQKVEIKSLQICSRNHGVQIKQTKKTFLCEQNAFISK